MNKRTISIISIVGILLICLVVFLIGKSAATLDSTILKDQEVEGLSFTNADINIEKGISTFTVNVTNTNKETYSLNYIEIVVTADNKETTTLIGYIGESIDSEETKLITASIDKDISNSKSLDYVINK